MAAVVRGADVCGLAELAGGHFRVLLKDFAGACDARAWLFADLAALYLVIVRRGIGVQIDRYSAGAWCVIHRFDARIGGGVICPSAGRMLRIR